MSVLFLNLVCVYMQILYTQSFGWCVAFYGFQHLMFNFKKRVSIPLCLELLCSAPAVF